LGPNSSDVTETAAANMKPELNPISAVPVCRAREVPDAASKKNAIGVGISATESQPVLAK
jgi:hypothetical protein